MPVSPVGRRWAAGATVSGPMGGDTAPVWALPPDEALATLGSSTSGLTEAEARDRLARHGPNELDPPVRTSVAVLLLRQFRNPLFYLLGVAGAVTFVIGESVDTIAIAIVLIFNAAVGFTQERRAEEALAALRQLTPQRASVVRTATERVIDARELVPGDVVLVEAGTRVPADLRILQAAGVEADESLLTGESTAVAKSATPVERATLTSERRCMLLAGTALTRGRCRTVVAATGHGTELGRIATSVAQAGPAETPLQRRISRLARAIGVTVMIVSTAAFAFGLAIGGSPGELLLTLVALAVSAIPEGLPIVLTITLAVGVRRMAARHAIVRHLPAAETLGSCTVIGSDKTGTLTENRMTVRRVFAGGRRYELSGSAYGCDGALLDEHERPADLASAEHRPLRLALAAGVLCNDATVVARADEYEVTGDPTEGALLVAAARAGIDGAALTAALPRVHEIPFDAERRFAATYHARAPASSDSSPAGPSLRGLLPEDAHRPLFVKGAPEQLLAMCSADADGPLDREAIAAEVRSMAGDGLRVLAMAYRGDGAYRDQADGELPRDGEHATAATPDGLTFLGLQGMFDPPRPEAAEAIRGCRQAGIRVLMITGDHAETARAVAREVGIGDGEATVLTGAEIEAATDEELALALRDTSVCARTSPEHKLRIVQALQRSGEIVAITGDGVNDAPALKAADIGVAMGRSGTDVAREAADMVVTDDNFASIVAAVEEGRIVFSNVRQATFYLISSGVAEVIAVLASIALNLALPFVPAQLLWLNVVTNGVQGVALAMEPGEQDILQQPPRGPREAVISRLLWERTLISALWMSAATLVLFSLAQPEDGSIERARTVALTAMVLFQVVHVGNSRSEHRSAFAKSPFSNRFLLVGSTIAVAMHVFALSFPPTQAIFRVEPLDLLTWLGLAAVATSVVVVVEIHKRLRRPA